MKFTYEVERDGCVTFLKVKVVKVDLWFYTGLFRKETFTGLATKRNSAEPIYSRYRIKQIQCLVTRAYKICSISPRFNSEIDFLRRYFVQKQVSLCTSEQDDI